jgi:hypothetical protein
VTTAAVITVLVPAVLVGPGPEPTDVAPNAGSLRILRPDPLN